MSTEYKIAPGIILIERSSRASFLVEGGVSGYPAYAVSPLMDAATLRTAIIKQIEVLSYISDDPDEVLQRFNIKYGDIQ